MERRTLGSASLQVSVLGLGTMTFGEQNTEADAHQQLDLAVSHGVNLIDTAEMYPVPPDSRTQGRTESYVGSWLARKRRDELVIATKVTGAGRGFSWIRGGPRLNRQHITEAVDASLRRLQTDYIDLYQIHWPDRNVPMFGQRAFDPTKERDTVPIEEQLAVFDDLVDAGKIRFLGLSNETPWGLAQFLHAAATGRHTRIVSIQNAYHLLNRSFEAGLSEISFREDIPLLAYSPLAFGWLSGKYLTGAGRGRITLFPGFGQRYDKPNVKAAVAAYAALAADLGLSPTALALAFVRSRPFVASVLLGATTLEQLSENLASLSVTLSADALSEIERISQQYPDPAP